MTFMTKLLSIIIMNRRILIFINITVRGSELRLRKTTTNYEYACNDVLFHDGERTTKENGSWTPTTHTYTDAYIPGEKRGREHENQDHKGMTQECMTQECVHDVKNGTTGE